MKLNVVWKTENEIDINNFLLMYLPNALRLGWFSEIEVVVWGASQNVVASDPFVQAEIIAMLEQGIKIYACIGCSERLGITEKLRDLGIVVEGTGERLSNYLKSDERFLMF